MMDKHLKKINFLDYKLFSDNLEALCKNKKILVNTINQYSYCIAEIDPKFKESLLNADVLLPDGIGIVWALNFLKGEKIKKITGADCHEFLLRSLNKNSGSCFYLGSSSETLDKIEKRCNEEYPNIIINKYSPPFKENFTDEENQNMVASINNFSPDVLFIGMTAPKQEKWANCHKEVLKANVICSIGAVFDFYSGTVERPNKIWQKLGLEWLGRLLKEPKRMWKRYLYYGPIFLKYLVADFIKNLKLNYNKHPI